MTRGNINFITQERGKKPKTLFVYKNGDQYPSGIRDNYNVLDLVRFPITEESFRKWVNENYPNRKLEDLGEGGQPKIYFTNGFITDYSYVFRENEVMVWNWNELIFNGDRKEFIKWIKNK